MPHLTSSKRIRLAGPLAALAVLALAAARPASAQSYTFTTLPDPAGAKNSTAYGINSAGQIAGAYPDSGSEYHGFVYANGGFTVLDDSNPNAFGTNAYGINDSGRVAGTYVNAATGGNIGFTETGGTYTDVSEAGAKNDPGDGTTVRGINSAGTVVGYYTDSSNVTHGFVDAAGSFTSFDDPLAAHGTYAYGINSTGEIVGTYTDSGNNSHGFTDIGGVFTTLDDPAAKQGTFAYGINDAGQVVGDYGASPNSFGFVYANGAYTNFSDPSASSITIAYGINNSGDIVGGFNSSSGAQAFLATPVTTPEPSPIVSLILGAFSTAGLMLRARRRA